MKKGFNAKSKLACILAMALLLLCIFVPASASDAPPVEWELSADDKTLTDSRGNGYTAYALPSGYSLDFKLTYYFANSVDVKNSYWGSSSVVSYAHDGKIIYLPALESSTEEYYEHIFVDEEAKGYLNTLVSGDSEILRLFNRDRLMYASMSRELLDAMAALTTEKKSVSVPTLLNETMCEIYAYDKTDSVRGAYGAIYEIDGAFYFVDYRTLGNNYFNADGSFSYRAGTIELTPLNDELTESVTALESKLSTIKHEIQYEPSDNDNSNPLTGDDETTLEIVMFWVIFVSFGFLLPIVPLTLGLVLFLKRKSEKPVHWLIVACIGGAWLLISLIIAIIIACI